MSQDLSGSTSQLLQALGDRFGPARLLDSLPVGICCVARDSTLAYYNAKAATLWGFEPGLGDAKVRTSLARAVVDFPTGRAVDLEQTPTTRVLQTGVSVRDERFVLSRPDGSRITVLVNVDPLLDSEGALVGVVSCFQDITSLTAALADDRAVDLARLGAIVESSDDAIISKSLDGRVRSWNAGAARIFGYEADEMIGEPIIKIIPPELRSEENDILARLKRGERIDHFETVRMTKDGRRLDISITVSPIRDRTGTIVGASKVARDITDKMRAEELQRLLMGELNHRVKNTLATVQSIANQTVRASKDPTEFAKSFNGRIRTLAHAHDVLTRNSWRGADLADLVREQLLIGGSQDERVRLSGPSVMLDAQPALHIAMILHELGTNARKHGSLSSPDGRLDASWSLESNGGRVLKLRWRESGGPPVTAPSARGFGTTLVEKSLAAHEGQAVIHYRAEGVACDIDLPLPERPLHDAGFVATAHTGGSLMSEGRSTKSELAGKRVLVIEDEPIVAMDLAGALTERGCSVVGPAATLEDAKRLVAETRLDVALVDANLGGQPVDEIAEALAKRNIPFAFVTGYDRDGLPAAFREAAMINKPFSREEIVQIVTRLVVGGDTVVRLRQRTSEKS